MPIFTKNNHVEKGLSFMLFDKHKLNIPLPPLPEQHCIAEILSVVDRKLELERRRKEKLERVKKGLMNELLTGRKRVKVE